MEDDQEGLSDGKKQNCVSYNVVVIDEVIIYHATLLYICTQTLVSSCTLFLLCTCVCVCGRGGFVQPDQQIFGIVD